VTTDTEPRGFRAVSWQPTPERWAAYLAPPTPDELRLIVERANTPTPARRASKRRRRLSKVTE
jgi:hypothetical protein